MGGMRGTTGNLFDFSQMKGPNDEPHVGGFCADAGADTAAADAAKPKGKADAKADVKAEAESPVAPAVKLSKASAPAELTVSAFLSRVKNALGEAFPSRVTVVGELSNVSSPASGHLYFSLKDASASVGCVMWKSRAGKLKFRPADGLEVVVEGRVDLYDPQGKLQLYAERITPRGEGALELAFRQLREKLQKEGLFDVARKKAIPAWPRAVGVVTSGTGAAIRDIQKTIATRWPGMAVYLLPVRVQGDGAAAEIAEAVAMLDANAEAFEIDTLIVGRGGGSLEDLWAFNEEVVARAVATATVPVISGVGHEVDVTICDLVADARAATPTAAAQRAVPDGQAYRGVLRSHSARLSQGLTQLGERARASLEAILRSGVFRDPSARVRTGAQQLDEWTHRLRAAQQGLLARQGRRLGPLADRLARVHPIRELGRSRARLDRLADRLRWALGGQTKRNSDIVTRLQSRLAAVTPSHRAAMLRQRLDALSRQLDAMSHQAILARGFSVTRLPHGQIVRSTQDLAAGVRIETLLADGVVASDVVEVTPSDPAKGEP